MGKFGHRAVPIGTMIAVSHILTITKVPIRSVSTGSVRNVVSLTTENKEVFLKIIFNSSIKLMKFYVTIEKHFEVK